MYMYTVHGHNLPVIQPKHYGVYVNYKYERESRMENGNGLRSDGAHSPSGLFIFKLENDWFYWAVLLVSFLFSYLFTYLMYLVPKSPPPFPPLPHTIPRKWRNLLPPSPIQLRNI